jgi:hypothetical protein
LKIALLQYNTDFVFSIGTAKAASGRFHLR